MMKKKKGTALLIVSFISIISAMLITSMATLSAGNSRQISDNRDGETAYYAAEAGVGDVMDYFDSNFRNWGKTLVNTDLPESTNKFQLANGGSYWIDSLSYENNNKIVIADIVGNYNGAYRKIRARVVSSIPKYFDDYGLLTDGTLTINGSKILEMSIHANDGLVLKGPTATENDAVATQSLTPTAEAPDPTTNPIGGYVEPIDVPTVPIDDLRTMAKEGITLDIGQADFQTRLNNSPAGSLIYITNTNKVTNQLNLTGNMQGRILFVDSDIVTNTKTLDVSNVMLVSSGALTLNGNVATTTSHFGQIDTVFACEKNITLNGSKKFESLFWTNGSFTQNGSSVAGRVIAQSGIRFNGNFVLESSNKLYDFGTFDNIATLSSWQQVSMEN